MESEEIRVAILREMYMQWHHSAGVKTINLEQLQVLHDWDELIFRKIVDRMAHENLIRAHGSRTYLLWWPGVLEAETSGIAQENFLAENKLIRTQVLVRLAKVYETKGKHARTHRSELENDLEIEEYSMVRNLTFLEHMGHVESMGGSHSITYRGIDAIKDLEQQYSLITEYERISGLQPQARGREFQDLIGRVIEDAGWAVEVSVRAEGEEMDVIANLGREYYLLECKWEKDPVGDDALQKLVGKLERRTGVHGMLVSMSGFTDPVVTNTGGSSRRYVILLFGRVDVESMIYQRAGFEDLLNAKFDELVKHRRVSFE